MAIVKNRVSVLDGSTGSPFTDRLIIGQQMAVANTSGGAGAAVTTTVTFSEQLPAVSATGSASFSGQPANNDTITIGGTAVTIVTAAPSGNQFQIGASLAATLANAVAFLAASVDANLVKFKYWTDGVSKLFFEAATPGTAGNALTLAKSSTAITLSAATLSGGLANYSVFVQPNQDATAYVTNYTNTSFQVVLTPRLAASSLAAGTFDVLVALA